MTQIQNSESKLLDSPLTTDLNVEQITQLMYDIKQVLSALSVRHAPFKKIVIS